MSYGLMLPFCLVAHVTGGVLFCKPGVKAVADNTGRYPADIVPRGASLLMAIRSWQRGRGFKGRHPWMSHRLMLPFQLAAGGFLFCGVWATRSDVPTVRDARRRSAAMAVTSLHLEGAEALVADLRQVLFI